MIHDQQNMILSKLNHQEWSLENEIEKLKMYTQQFAKIDTLKVEKGTGGQACKSKARTQERARSEGAAGPIILIDI